MSDEEHFSNTNNNPLDTWSTCDNSLNLNQQTACQVQVQSFDSKCRTRSRKEQEYLEAVWSIQQVPLNFGVVSKPSAAVERVLETQRADYDAALESFKNELDSLHKTCEAEIEDLKKKLQIEIDKIHARIENEKNSFCEIECLNDENYNELRDKVEPMMGAERTIIDQLFERVQAIESRRRSSATETIKKYHLILTKLSYLPKDDFRELMERKIMEYNQAALDNYEKYEELQSKLGLSADIYKQNVYLWIKDMKENRKTVCRKNALNEFYIEYDSFQNAGQVYFQIIEGRAALCCLKSRKNLISETVAHWDTTVPFSAARFDEQSNELDSVISSTDATVTSFIESCKFYMSRHLGRLLSKVNKLKTIDDESDKTPDVDIQNVQDIYDRAKERTDRFIAELDDTWSRILNNLQTKAKKIFKPFQDFGSPWDVQSANFAKLQTSTIEQLQNRAVKNESKHLDFQEKINAEIVKLREEENVPKLEKKLPQVLALLDRKAQKYKSDFEEDCTIIRKCKDTVKKELVGMQNKIDKFLKSNKPVEPSNSCSKSSNESMEDDGFYDSSLEDFILREVQLIEKQTDSLDHWKYIFLKNIATYRTIMEKDILDLVHSWQEGMVLEGSQFIDENLKAVEELREDTRAKAYDVRLNELLDHRQKLEFSS